MAFSFLAVLAGAGRTHPKIDWNHYLGIMFISFIRELFGQLQFKILKSGSGLNGFSFIRKSLGHLPFKILLPKKLRILILSVKKAVSQ